MCLMEVMTHRQNGKPSIVEHMFGNKQSAAGGGRPAAARQAVGRNQGDVGDARASANSGTVLTSGSGVSVFAPRENKTLLGQ